MKISRLSFFIYLISVWGYGQDAFSPKYKIILISEIFPDPSHAIGLPEKEFVEIYNKSNDTISLNNFSISDLAKSYLFKNYTLMPGAYLILCKASDTAAFHSFGPTLGFVSFVTLNNDGDHLTLKDGNGHIVDEFQYTTSYQSGKTLELKNPFFLCDAAANWMVSLDAKGGTPGRVNSQFQMAPDTTATMLVNVSSASSQTLALDFSFPLYAQSLLRGTFNIDGGNISGTYQTTSTGDSTIFIRLDNPIFQGRNYDLEVSSLKDCKGNVVNVKKNFVLPEAADSFDIVINEILFNPDPGNVDFIEIYNRSNKYIDLKNWQVANFQNQVVSNQKNFLSHPFLIPPQGYLAVTSDVDKLCLKYPACKRENIIENDLPAFDDMRGTSIILNSNRKISDWFNYDEGYQFPLLESKEGVALERLNADASTNMKDNWHSAASAVGYATPGYANSQQVHPSSKKWNVEPAAFSPDGDGYKDITCLLYNGETPGTLLNVCIYDASGRKIKHLLRNDLLSPQGFIQWDGTRDDMTLAAPGQYVFYGEEHTLQGNVETFKKKVAIVENH